ncbi:RNA polymerase sigma-70 factor (ECF subfamily) [Actinoplanes octamycinicus]|uniref:RNA polymerase sigma-70 factor (ECF subfamily) n=1 Tax=Actinoplanes octamycinicus TaxID=135948 RepID=A0A7W7M9E4_9ACTN|nr:RNA polymerase sigma-70 factor [Actinoplanes octamycinicus]MBB4741904.1 RNA polymerase sigma-70 factor (ECF subfamily) [Actinoplanes octamycinicus]GIE60667.1 DNA-directed RNA polymerase sigma-70 factor [Actinoplanes octamycinicus]
MTITELYDELRPRAFAIAYRMLGSVSEAEDVVQEAFLRAHQSLRRDERIASPRAYLATLVTRLAIDQLRSARARRERYVGEWLPEPLVTGPGPADRAETADSLSLAFLVLLESLSPAQRAAFLLREVFDYPYPEVAEIVGSDVDGARHLVARARAHLRDRRPRRHATRQQRDELARGFFAAAGRGDLAALEALLTRDVTLHGDGGGRVPALGRPVTGRERVARTMGAGLAALARFEVRLELVEVNGQPGALARDARDRLVGVLALDIADGRIRAIHSVVNPDKLRHLGEVSDLGLRTRRARRSGPEG